MGTVTVGIGEWAVSSAEDDLLKTYALGSCVAVCVYDAKLRLAGLLHVALPDSSVDPVKSVVHPGYFADTGLSLMIEELKAAGALRSHVWIKLAGGASVMDDHGLFDIGRRNVLAIKKLLWKSSLGPIAEDVGGTISRTVSLAVGSGELLVSSSNRRWSL
jgi:chemotaxis protein CheD